MERYVLHDEFDNPMEGTWTLQWDDILQRKIAFGQGGKRCAIIAYQYELTDTELVDPFEEEWPPPD